MAKSHEAQKSEKSTGSSLGYCILIKNYYRVFNNTKQLDNNSSQTLFFSSFLSIVASTSAEMTAATTAESTTTTASTTRRGGGGGRFVVGFPDNNDAPVFNPELATKLVGYGCKRVKRAGIKKFEPATLRILQEKEEEAHHDNTTDTNDDDDNDYPILPMITHSDIVLGSCIGKGSFSSVFSVESVSSKSKSNDDDDGKSEQHNSNVIKAEKVVVKVLRRKMMLNPKMFAACAGDLCKEGIILSTLNHKNIISVKGFAANGINAYKSGRHDAFFIVLDRQECMLSDKIVKWQSQKKKLNLVPITTSKLATKKSMILQSRSDIILQLADAIKYIHSRGMIHRDIKPDNIGFDREGTLKLFDFDVARFLPESAGVDDTFKFTKKVGSPRYMSPENALGLNYNAKTDVYSFGLVMYELLTLIKPYSDLPSEAHVKVVFMGNERPTIPNSWTAELSSIVERCWSPRLRSRPTMIKVRQLLEKELPRYLNAKKTKLDKKSWSLLGTKTTTATKATVPQ